MKRVVLTLLFLGVVIPLAWILYYKYEGDAPQTDISLPSQYLKKTYEMNLTVRDRGTGLRRVMVSLMQKGNEKILLDKTYPPSSIMSLFSDNKQEKDSFVIPVESRKYGMNDGDAVIRILVTDYSWHGWNKGNRYYEERPVIIDTKPPQIRVLSKQHNLARGGSGLVIYKVMEENISSGVMVGDNFYPGHSGMFKDPKVFACFFALDHTQGPGTRIFVRAQDPAGNEAKRGFYHYIKDKNFRTDVLNIPDRFLERKMPDIDVGVKEDEFAGAENPLLAKFLYVNKELRRQNVDTVLSFPADTVNEILWKGRFGRLAGAANRARYADHRIYKYKGKEIDRATHLGVDLASTSNAAVGAVNRGRVIMSKDVGIFGNTIIIDHGFGLASLYSHLSDTLVQPGDVVEKGTIIGKTGLTGLAGGDHLHLSIIVHNRFVDPVEWWDANWIKNNITSKVEAVRKQLN
ncbi:MAG: M23 family metallopeptidase [Desulfobacter sp.]|nr:MAG: M23 family metallopeptidase [Desulfobacter sp.]